MRFAWSGVMAAAIVAFGCGGGEVTGTAEGLEVSVALSASEFTVGEELQVTVRAENATSRVLLPELGPCVLTFEVLNLAGDVVTADQPCPLVQWIDRLAPGEAYEFTFAWHGDTGVAPQTFLPGGSYRVRGILDLRSGAVRSASVPVDLEG